MTHGENTPMWHGRGQIVGILQPLERLQDDSGVGCESTSEFCLVPTPAKWLDKPFTERRSVLRVASLEAAAAFCPGCLFLQLPYRCSPLPRPGAAQHYHLANESGPTRFCWQCPDRSAGANHSATGSLPHREPR